MICLFPTRREYISYLSTMLMNSVWKVSARLAIVHKTSSQLYNKFPVLVLPLRSTGLRIGNSNQILPFRWRRTGDPLPNSHRLSAHIAVQNLMITQNCAHVICVFKSFCFDIGSKSRSDTVCQESILLHIQINRSIVA